MGVNFSTKNLNFKTHLKICWQKQCIFKTSKPIKGTLSLSLHNTVPLVPLLFALILCTVPFLFSLSLQPFPLHSFRSLENTPFPFLSFLQTPTLPHKKKHHHLLFSLRISEIGFFHPLSSPPLSKPRIL